MPNFTFLKRKWGHGSKSCVCVYTHTHTHTHIWNQPFTWLFIKPFTQVVIVIIINHTPNMLNVLGSVDHHNIRTIITTALSCLLQTHHSPLVHFLLIASMRIQWWYRENLVKSRLMTKKSPNIMCLDFKDRLYWPKPYIDNQCGFHWGLRCSPTSFWCLLVGSNLQQILGVGSFR